MKKKKLLVPFAVVFLLSFLAATAFAHHEFLTVLSGKNEAPPVKTMATGKAVFRMVADHGTIALDYELNVKNIRGATAAHIHLGKPGESGPPVVVLFNGPAKKGKFSGVLAKGRIAGKDLVGPLEGKTLSDLVGDLEKGNAYINVHTKKHPDGEIRGQVKYSK